MVWTLEFSKAALSSLKKMDSQTSGRIVDFLEDRVSVAENPRSLGAALTGKRYQNIWRYRVGDYRVLAEIHDSTVTILVVEIGHRREVYR